MSVTESYITSERVRKLRPNESLLYKAVRLESRDNRRVTTLQQLAVLFMQNSLHVRAYRTFVPTL